jgi:hypothetical protein
MNQVSDSERQKLNKGEESVKIKAEINQETRKARELNNKSTAISLGEGEKTPGIGPQRAPRLGKFLSSFPKSSLPYPGIKKEGKKISKSY